MEEFRFLSLSKPSHVHINDAEYLFVYLHCYGVFTPSNIDCESECDILLPWLLLDVMGVTDLVYVNPW